MGQWKNWPCVPKERRDRWWHAFVQHYYWDKKIEALVYFRWKLHTRTSICERISKKKRKHKQPAYINEDQWALMLEDWSTEPALKKSKTAADNQKSDPDGKGMHNHCAGPVCFEKIEYDMMIEAGDNKPPPYTELLRKTRTHKDGTFIDQRAKDFIAEVELSATQLSSPPNGSPNQDTQTDPSATMLSRTNLNRAYLQCAKKNKGYVYGLGSTQYRDFNPNETVYASLSPAILTWTHEFLVWRQSFRPSTTMLKQLRMMLQR